MKNALKAFTLAEILITLVVIGIVAALTIPAVISANSDRALIAATKKAYATIQSAYALMQNADPKAVERIDAGKTNIALELAPYLNLAKDCGNDIGCFPNVNYKIKDGTSVWNFDTTSSMHKLLLADGMSFAGEFGGLYVDVNGSEGPNVIGKDLHSFVFDLNNTKVYPFARTDDDCTAAKQESASCGYCILFKNSMECTIPDDVLMVGVKLPQY